jgi:CBS domain-containing protein
MSDVLHSKGHDVITVRTGDSIMVAVRRLAERRIGALVVEDQWTKLVGIFSERNFINAVARDGASVLGFAVQQLMSSPIISCRSDDRIGAVLATSSPAGDRGW